MKTKMDLLQKMLNVAFCLSAVISLHEAGENSELDANISTSSDSHPLNGSSDASIMREPSQYSVFRYVGGGFAYQNIFLS